MAVGSLLETRQHEILRAASRLFRERGFHATGMRDIAAALGMTVGNVYYYFRNKQHLLAFCQADTLARLLAMAKRVESTRCPVPQRLWLIIAGHVHCLNEGVPGSLAHLEVEALEAEDRRRIVRLRDRYEKTLRRLIATGVEDGSFVDVNDKIATMAILGALNWTVKWFRPEGKLPATNISEAFASQLVRGLMKPDVLLRRPEESYVRAVQEEDPVEV